MNVVVTGATGGVGSWLVDHFADDGHEVLGLDLERPPGEHENATFLATNLTDQGQTWDAILAHDPDAVVHFAAVPRPGIEPDARTFLTNVESTYHVLEAAGRAGANVVWASSESIYGSVFADEPWLPEYFPVDEAHSRRPADPYATSKLVGEEIAAMAARKHGISVTSIRPSWVTYPGEKRTARAREAFDPATAEPNGNFWTYVDVRDVVSIVAAALENAPDGHETYLAAAAENFLDRPTAATIETVFGDLPAECDLEGDESAFSTAKARSDLGWEPTHSWREAETEPLEGPAFLER
ncbi:NAD-dependent epimerase/dehydratase family protein [Halobiforma nitratireducens]|uniref:NAD-dependent epimerase/dehydratase n=1 Tax=Halobiforma nitratireducens JCM 10879 TaxID=1227454 RepID=M0LUK5_9EURY|nr:NAD(P)-dependent oxidoreductase [Halobiforma nitratireducens]EMA36853.1 NAD-dependent epimerase/dehydratase [Halobiforma nitratireducens JCM 10879]